MARGPRSALAMPTHENTRMRTTPIPVPKSQRALEVRTLTTIPAGFITPLVAFPLLREDALTSCRLNFGFELYETVDLLANPVLLNVRAYVVPWLAFDRFNGSIDTLNRSYKGEAEPGGSVVPWFRSTSTAIGPATNQNQVLFHLGCHMPAAGCNYGYNEAYNAIVRHRYVNRSPELKVAAPLPDGSDKKLYPAMWRHPDLGHIVPDFDQATLDGEVALTVTNPLMPVRGLATKAPPNASATQSAGTKNYTDGYVSPANTKHWQVVQTPGTTAGQTSLVVDEDAARLGFPAIFAELSADGVHVSLSDINTAQRARAFAALRKAYAGYDDEYIKDLLMSGIRMPTEAEKQPILLSNVMTQFGQGKRFSTDSLDLTASVSSGAASVAMNLRCPAMNTGGVVMVTAEVYPEQLWERRQDPFLNSMLPTAPGDVQLPEYVRDTLDPEKVDIVQCGYVDVQHATPTATFGYEPLNAKWQTFPPRVGGKFYRPAVDLPADEDRARIWASETVNPTLSRDFYLVTNLNLKPFVVTDQDPCEALVRGRAVITGNTVFGLPLIESGDEYDTVMDQADMDRIDKVDVATSDVLEPLPAEGTPEGESDS